MNYFASFFLLVVLVTLIFRFTTAILLKMPNNLANNAWFLSAIIGSVLIVIIFMSPYFFKKHTRGNKIFMKGEFKGDGFAEIADLGE